MHTKSRPKRSPVWLGMDDESFKKLVKNSQSYSEILLFFKLKNKGGNINTVKARIEYLSLDDSHIPRGMGSNKNRKFHRFKKPLKKILVENSNYSTYDLKKRLFSENIVEEKCAECGIGNEWNGKPIALHLDHINGVSTDHRIDNLQILCPNCHSQTENYAGKNRPARLRRKPSYCPKCGEEKLKTSKHCRNCREHPNKKVENRPSKEELKILIENNTWTALGKMYGVSDNAVRKWAKKYELIV